MHEQEVPRVILRGRADGDSIILPMGSQQAHIMRKASRVETGGHWALGEAWQDPGFDNPPHTHDEAEAFYVLEGAYTFYTDTDPAEGVGRQPRGGLALGDDPRRRTRRVDARPRAPQPRVQDDVADDRRPAPAVEDRLARAPQHARALDRVRVNGGAEPATRHRGAPHAPPPSRRAGRAPRRCRSRPRPRPPTTCADSPFRRTGVPSLDRARPGVMGT